MYIYNISLAGQKESFFSLHSNPSTPFPSQTSPTKAMYGHINSSVFDCYSGLFSHSSLSPSSSQSQSQSQSQCRSLSGEFNSTAPESAATLFYAHESSSSGSRPSSYTYIGSPTSPPSCCTSSHTKSSIPPVLQRSLSIHPLQNQLHPPTYLPGIDARPVRQQFRSKDLDQVIHILHRNYCIVVTDLPN